VLEFRELDFCDCFVTMDKKFQSFAKSFEDAFRDKFQNGKKLQEAMSEKWRSIRSDPNEVDRVTQCNIAIVLKKKSQLIAMFSRKTQAASVIASVRMPSDNVTSPVSAAGVLDGRGSSASPVVITDEYHHSDDAAPPEPKRPTLAPKQDSLKSKLTAAKTKLEHLRYQRDKNIGDIAKSQIDSARAECDEIQKKIDKQVRLAEANRKCRSKRKSLLQDVSQKVAHLGAQMPFNIERTAGRPSLDREQPGILEAIANIALACAGADDKRRRDVMNSVRTLDDLKRELDTMGFQIGRTTLYRRLEPKNSKTAEGKRHVNTVKVRLRRPDTTGRDFHMDTWFCQASIRNLTELATMLNPRQVCLLSVDDKCRIPIGVAAVGKQSPLLMSSEYRLEMPDHDFVKAPRHKLIPSVTAAIQIQDGKFGNWQNISYSGPTYVAVRNGKTDSSTAATHAFDLDYVLTTSEPFAEFARFENRVKPVLMIFTDNGPDEAPRSCHVQMQAMITFKKHNLDALYLAANAPKRSAFNWVERRMAPLTAALTGVILPHDTYGTHLDSQGRTTDQELENRNFEAAGKTLAHIFGNLVIDEFDVEAKYHEPGAERDSSDVMFFSEEWKARHVRTSQYLVQVVKCSNLECCDQPRTNLRKLLPDRFMPSPLPVDKSLELNVEDGKYLPLMASLVFQRDHSKQPYDKYLPTCLQVGSNALNDRTCIKCNLYHCSGKRRKEHQKCCTYKQITESPREQITTRVRPQRVAARRQRELMVQLVNDGDLEFFDEDELDLNGLDEDKSETEETRTPVIDIDRYLQTPFIEDDL
jgi:hypothetical protein